MIMIYILYIISSKSLCEHLLISPTPLSRLLASNVNEAFDKKGVSSRAIRVYLLRA